MTKNLDFDTLLANGHGRAVVWLQTHDPAPYRDAILNACLHNLCYDRQCEGDRAPYLFEVIRTSGDSAWFRNRILEALAGSTDEYDASQLFSLAGLFARHGDSGAREALYAAFDRSIAEDDYFDPTKLALLDGVAGLVYAADRIPPEADGEEPWQLLYALRKLENRDGKEAIRTALAALGQPRIVQLLAAAQREEAEHEAKRHRGPRPALTLADIRSSVERKPTGFGRYQWTRWGEAASEEDLQQIANDVLVETDPTRLTSYLRVFLRRAFPLHPESLICLAVHEDSKVAWAAQTALEQIKHPCVRTFGLELSRDPDTLYHAVGILNTNHEEDDDALVAGWMENPPENRDALHHLGSSVLEYAKAHDGPDVDRALLALYEFGPCSLCRNSAVERLLENGPLPAYIRDECRFDADEDTRKKAQTTP